MEKSPRRIGYGLSLSGALASNGKTAQLAHQSWQESLDKNGNLLGRRVELVCLDDQTNSQSTWAVRCGESQRWEASRWRPVPQVAAQVNGSGMTTFGPAFQGEVTQKFVMSGEDSGTMLIEVNGNMYEVRRPFTAKFRWVPS